MHVVRLKNKIESDETPLNYHLNVRFQPEFLAVALVVEIQIWFADLMAFNDRSHRAYEAARAAAPGDV